MRSARPLTCMWILFAVATAASMASSPAAAAEPPSGGRLSPPPLWGSLSPGPFDAGFQLIEVEDPSRTYPAGEAGFRKVRMYLWYPATPSSSPRLTFGDFVRMGEQDFSRDGTDAPRGGTSPNAGPPAALPVPLAKGLDPPALETLLASPSASVRDADPDPGPYPLLVFGQGLYYESPVSNLVLCEYLASHGYVVATCPLLGTRYRLVNRNVEDLETEIRDMEVVLGRARALRQVDNARLGVIGYDLGGMAGLTLCMRHPEVRVFLSLDSGILTRHPMGIPGDHPSYREDAFVIPWMHMMQARFLVREGDGDESATLFDRKRFGDSYLVHVPTTSHGDFTTFALAGIDRAVPGYWGPPGEDPRALHEDLCADALSFLDAYLRGEDRAREALRRAVAAPEGSRRLKIEWKEGLTPPPGKDAMIHIIIQQGLPGALPAIDQALESFRPQDLFDEGVLNWLGYHFLYWWGREEDAVQVFELTTRLFPASANAYDSLGEAYVAMGRTEDAVASYGKSLELDPGNRNAKAMLERLRAGSKAEEGAK